MLWPFLPISFCNLSLARAVPTGAEQAVPDTALRPEHPAGMKQQGEEQELEVEIKKVVISAWKR